jgi:hypothetical protein
MKKLLFALLGLGAFVFAPAKAEAFFFRCFPCQPLQSGSCGGPVRFCQPCGGSGGSRVTTQCQWPTQAVAISSGPVSAPIILPSPESVGIDPRQTEAQRVESFYLNRTRRVTTQCQWPTQAVAISSGPVSAPIILPSPESVGIDPRQTEAQRVESFYLNRTPGFPYPNQGSSGSWVVYPNQESCPNGNCPQPIRLR